MASSRLSWRFFHRRAGNVRLKCREHSHAITLPTLAVAVPPDRQFIDVWYQFKASKREASVPSHAKLPAIIDLKWFQARITPNKYLPCFCLTVTLWTYFKLTYPDCPYCFSQTKWQLNKTDQFWFLLLQLYPWVCFFTPAWQAPLKTREHGRWSALHTNSKMLQSPKMKVRPRAPHCQVSIYWTSFLHRLLSTIVAPVRFAHLVPNSDKLSSKSPVTFMGKPFLPESSMFAYVKASKESLLRLNLLSVTSACHTNYT